MKKIIRNKLYDTKTAKEIGRKWVNRPGDFNFIDEALYVKKTGEYFLYGYGGPNTHYAKSVGNNEWSGSETITPMSYDTAKAWAEENLTADEYMSAFGEVDEGDGKETLSVALPAALASALRKEAQSRSMTLSAIITEKLTNKEEK